MPQLVDTYAPPTYAPPNATYAARALMLYELIRKHLDVLDMSGLGVSSRELKDRFKSEIYLAIKVFVDRYLLEGVTECHIEYWGYHLPKNTLVFHLRVVVDADAPLPGSPQLPHFGWEIHHGRPHMKRVSGPGHVYFQDRNGPISATARLPNWDCVEARSSWLDMVQSTYEGGRVDKSIRWFKMVMTNQALVEMVVELDNTADAVAESESH
ncbi:hypothetical protein BDZ89DRAFT_1143913 [Hymenopellis radicata]|nr:hypothetical protein BDZ89DRAFT_1143913 [Hymenopellis radicata]